MRLAILDGNPAAGGAFDEWVERFAAALETEGHAVRRLALRELSLAQCKGCFACWLRTPGRCSIRDDGEVLLRAVLESDLVVHASPVSMGFVSPLLKRAQERLLPILHPFMQIVAGEVHHRLRYDRYPRIALVHGHLDCDGEDARILEDIYRAVALETHVSLALTASTEEAPEEVARAIGRA